ncbi:6-phosphofructokinase [Sporobacter termitidis DSM 10068]|uniref:ATP-dependent 6-phosphofructokinase n=1 Tax=Sporobacter termitidis DSM 10068 TaxID=1123282 RepID=A0A1M5TP27_9FIRM|nr:6-phosphofructokinase [Sporobacter termitidis]SHH52512.1 6-phosphofructokinase [Sporobacter termitidis DSM 10068]
MSNSVKRIGVLTSGGDAPGMNAAIRAVVLTSIHLGIDCVGIRRGYTGLISGDIVPMTAEDVNGIERCGGTILYTARSAEFQTEKGLQRAVDNCKFMDIEGLVVIGGDGSYRGALELSRHGVPVVGLPGTIDNDIGCTSYTIGFDTACNTAIDAVDKLDDTMQAHERCSVVEVMGHRAGHLALNVGIATGATVTLIPEMGVDFEADVSGRIRSARLKGQTHFTVIVAEGAASAHEVAEKIKAATGIDTRVTTLGHIQRGGSPLIRDRVTAARMGYKAVRLLADGVFNRIICMNGEKCVDYDIEEALNMTKGLDEDACLMQDALMS